MAATWFPSLVLTQPFQAAWPQVPITKVCSWSQPMKTSVKFREERTNAFFFWINKTGKAIKSPLWDLFIINYRGTMQPPCERTYMCCSHVPLCEDCMPCAHARRTQSPLSSSPARVITAVWTHPCCFPTRLSVTWFSVQSAVKCSSVKNNV